MATPSDSEYSTDSEGSSPQSPTSSSPLLEDQLFRYFTRLPPEIRHQIYMAAIPSPGINFFNIHTFPNDHEGANRSTSPPNLHLDLRRLSIHHDDETVAKYDPSVWQIRHALRQLCREARAICAIPEDKLINMTLTIPKRGLFVHAGDGQLRSQTPFTHPRPQHEPVVRRQVQICADDVVCMSVENCSFNIVFEETTMFQVGRDDEEDEESLGWAYDPQFDRGVTLGIPKSRYCLGLARDHWATIRALEEVGYALFEAATGTGDNGNGRPDATCSNRRRVSPTKGFVMFDAGIGDPVDSTSGAASENTLRFWDRWGDSYTTTEWADDALFTDSQLVKVRPETNQLRTRYLRSALMKSSKRPA